MSITSTEIKARAAIIETREKLERVIEAHRSKYEEEIKPLQNKLEELQKKCSHPNQPYNNGKKEEIGWTCPDCKASL